MSNIDLINFEIAITKRRANRYNVSVDSPDGDPDGQFILPANDRAYQQLIASLRAGDRDAAQELGQWLFELLFTTDIKIAYRSAMRGLGADQRLRVFLKFNQSDGEITALPWELLRDPDYSWLALHPNTPVSIVRYLRLRSAPTPKTPPPPLPLRVLLTAAEPTNEPPIAATRELDAITKVLSLLELKGLAKVEIEPHVTPEIFERRIGEGFHVWHFVGHGTFSEQANVGQLCFEDQTKSSIRLDAEDICLRLGGNALRLVVLNACRSGQINTAPFRNLITSLLRHGIPTVVGMQSEVSTDTARDFAAGFYDALVQGWPIDIAATEGRRQVARKYAAALPDWSIPVMYTRVRHCKLFDLPLERGLPPTTQRPAHPLELEQTIQYLIEIGVFRYFVSREWIRSLERQENGQSAVKQMLARIPIILMHNVSEETIHNRTIDMIAYALVRASQEQSWLVDAAIGDQGLNVLIKTLLSGLQQDALALHPQDSTELKYLREMYVKVFDKLQHTPPPPIEPASDDYSDNYDDLLIELTDVWQRLPPSEGIFGGVPQLP